MQDHPSSNLSADAPRKRVIELRAVLTQTSRNTVWLVLAQSCGRVLGLIYILILTRFLSLEVFGFYSLLLSFFAIAEQAGDLGLSRLLIRDLARDAARIPSYTGAVFPLKVLSTGAAYLILVAALWAGGYPTELVDLGAVGGLILIPSGLVLPLRNILHSQQRFVYDAVIQLVVLGSQSAIGSIILVLGGGLTAVLSSGIVVYILYFLILLRGCGKRGYEIRLHGGGQMHPRQLLGAALPYLGIALLSICSGRLEPVLLGRFSDAASLGLFGAASKITDAAVFVPSMFALALTPIFSRYHAESPESLSQLFLWSTRVLFFIMVPGAALVVLLAPEIIGLLYPIRFAAAARLLQILFCAQPLIAANLLFITILCCSDRQRQMVSVLLATTAAQLALDLTLIPLFGADGAAIAIVATQATMTLVLMFLLRRWSLAPGILARTLMPIAVALAGLGAAAFTLWSSIGPLALLAGIVTYLVIFAAMHVKLPYRYAAS